MDIRVTETNIEKSAEILRMALPILSRNKIPVTPENYTVWFHYIQGDIQELNDQIDRHLQTNKPFSPEFNDTLYRKHFEHRQINQIESARNQLTNAISETSGSIGETSNDAQRFSEILDNFNTSCDTASSISDVLGVLKDVLGETQLMKDSMGQMQVQFDTRTAELNKLREELDQVRHQASTDPLTSLANRGTFNDTLETLLSSSEASSKPLTLVMFDIDHFKRINDSFGHLVGDKVIRFVADILRKSTKGGDTPARFGGEEFAIILPDTQLEGGIRLAEKIRAAICATNLVKSGGQSLGRITVSGGVSQYQNGEDADSFIYRADKALYESKNNGRNCVSRAV